MFEAISVIVADPDPAIIESAREALLSDSLRGYEVYGATTGATACELIYREATSVAIIGEGLRGPRSEEIIAACADEMDFGAGRVGALVRRRDAASVKRMAMAGATSCLLKPFKAEEFRVWVASILGFSARLAAHSRAIGHGTRRSFVALIAGRDEVRAMIRLQLEAAGTLVAIAPDIDSAIALGRSPYCAAIVAVEPIPGAGVAALVGAARVEGVRVPIMRTEEDRRRRQGAEKLPREFGPSETAALLDALGYLVSDAFAQDGAA